MSLPVVLNYLSAAVARAWTAFILIIAFATIPFNSRAETRVLTNAWSFVLGSGCWSSPAIAEDGTIYFGLFNGDFRAFRPDGTPEWVFHGDREITSSPAVGADGTIYFGSRGRRLYALGPDGKKKWEFKTGGWVDCSPALARDGTIYFGSWDKDFYALNPDGSQQWRFPTRGEIVSSAAIGADGTIYFGSHDRRFYAVTPAGQKAWEYVSGGPIISSPAIDRDGTLYFTSVDGFFYALLPSGSLKWRLKTGGVTESSPVIGEDGTIYVGVNTALWAISPDGKKKWEQPYGDNALIEVTPLAFDDNTVCCVSRLGTLVNLGAPNQFNWSYYQNWYSGVSPTVGRDGKIYTMVNIVGTGILLCALQTEVRVANSPWPKFRADAQATGRAKATLP